MFALFCALLQFNLALEDELVADTDMDVEEDPILGRWGGLGYGGRHGGWGLGRGLGRVWDDEEIEEDPVLGLGRVGLSYGRLGHLGRVGGWGSGRGIGRVWDEEESDDIENDEDAVARMRGSGRMGHLGMGHRLGLGLGLRSHRMGLHGLGILGRRHGMGILQRELWDEDESEDVENDAILGRRHGLGGWGLRGLWDDEDELMNEPQRGGSGNFRCRNCWTETAGRIGRKWVCKTCRMGNQDEVSDMMLTGRRMMIMGCRGLGCMRRMCLRCRVSCMPCLRCPMGRMCRRVCRRVLC